MVSPVPIFLDPSLKVEGRSQLLTLSPGVHLFKIRSQSPPRPEGALSPFHLPALCLTALPARRGSGVVSIGRRRGLQAWLHAGERVIVVTVERDEAMFFLTSVPTPDGDTLAYEIQSFEGDEAENAERRENGSTIPGIETNRGIEARVDESKAQQCVPLEIMAHVRNRGDMTFVDLDWAGRLQPGLWIEAFAIRPRALLEAGDIEYRALTASGVETPWVSAAEICGNRGRADPLVAFMVRPTSRAARAGYSCEYGGYFASGRLVGPMKNGAPCRSPQKKDPLEGIQLRITRDRTNSEPNV